ncbi:MAG: hypothetical protein ACTS5A_02695 [Candidatus Hodgkinia cicadicola]
MYNVKFYARERMKGWAPLALEVKVMIDGPNAIMLVTSETNITAFGLCDDGDFGWRFAKDRCYELNWTSRNERTNGLSQEIRRIPRGSWSRENLTAPDDVMSSAGS